MTDSNRLEELEVRFSFQEELLQALNETVARQDDELVQLREAVLWLREQLKQVTPSQIADISEETPPPHY